MYHVPYGKYTQPKSVMCSATLSPGMLYPSCSLYSRLFPSMPTVSHPIQFESFYLYRVCLTFFFVGNFPDKKKTVQIFIFHLRLAQLPLIGDKLRYLLPQQLLTLCPFLQGVLVQAVTMFSSLVPGAFIHPFNHLFNSTNIC